MTDPNQPQRKGAVVSRVEWGVISSLLISALTSAFTFGIIYGQVNRNEVRITKLELQTGEFTTALARIDANVTFLTEAAREERARRR